MASRSKKYQAAREYVEMSTFTEQQKQEIASIELANRAKDVVEHTANNFLGQLARSFARDLFKGIMK